MRKFFNSLLMRTRTAQERPELAQNVEAELDDAGEGFEGHDEDSFNRKIYLRVGVAFVLISEMTQTLLGGGSVVLWGIGAIGWTLLALWSAGCGRQSLGYLFGYFAGLEVYGVISYFIERLSQG